MAWQAMAGAAGLDAVGKTLSAITNAQMNKAKEEQMRRALRATLHANNEKLMRSRSSYAVKGIAAGVSLGVNEERQAAMRNLSEFAVQSDSLRKSTQAGFINAALGSSVSVAQAVGSYRTEQLESQRVEKLESLVKRKESLLG